MGFSQLGIDAYAIKHTIAEETKKGYKCNRCNQGENCALRQVSRSIEQKHLTTQPNGILALQLTIRSMFIVKRILNFGNECYAQREQLE
jgi:hypothetical protein